MIVNIPYQNTPNKKIFDYINTCSQQLSNANFANNVNSPELEQQNKIYLLISAEGKIYLFCALSAKDDNDNFVAIDRIWYPLQGAVVENKATTETLVYAFDIKKFYSTLTFASNYKDRDNIKLSSSDDGNELIYSAANVVNVPLALKTVGSMYDKIFTQYCKDMNKLEEENAKATVMQVSNVDKNSFLLPYFNHKECLNFAVAKASDRAHICQNNNRTYFVVIHEEGEDKELKYMSRNLLRNDKFNVFNIEGNVISVSTGLWLMFTVLQNSKIWRLTNVYINHAEVFFEGEVPVYHFFDKDAAYYYNTLSYGWLKNFKYVGKLNAEEVFTLNKLYTGPKTSYFDFSRQVFVGSNYVFDDNPKDEDGNYKTNEIPFQNQVDSELPLKLTFMELKHYIGSDLSQKTFILKFYTDGSNVMIEKWDKDETKNETVLIFNHTMSKTYLGI